MSQSNQVTRKQQIKNMIKKCKKSENIFNNDQSQANFNKLCKDFSVCPQAQERGLTNSVFNYIVHMETFINNIIMESRYDADSAV